MTNSLKLSFISVIAVACAFFGMTSMAHAADLTFSAATTVTIGANNYLIEAGGEATSFVVDTTTATIVVPGGASLVFNSPSVYRLNNDQGIAQQCSDGNYSKLIINGPETVVITPDTGTTTCESSGGGGGGGSSKKKKTTPATPATPAVPGVSPAVPSTGATHTYTGVLKVGSTGASVMALQTKLGLSADGQFGPATKKAVMDFQAANMLTADGVVGPATWAKLMGTTMVMTPTTAATSVGLSGILKVGSTGASVMALQTKLGLSADGQFGPATKKAVMDFQAANMLTADGVVGAMTWAKLGM